MELACLIIYLGVNGMIMPGSSAYPSGHLLRCKSLETTHCVGDFRRLTSGLNDKHA